MPGATSTGGGLVPVGAGTGAAVDSGAQPATAQNDENGGAWPVPYRQPSTEPSVTVVLLAPAREYEKPPAPGAARKYTQYRLPGPMRHDS